MTDESSEKDRATSKLSEEFISLRAQQTRRRTFSGVKWNWPLDKTIKISLYCCVVLITAAASGRRCEIEMLISSAHSSHIHFYWATWNGNFKKTSQKCLWRACWVNWPFPHFSISFSQRNLVQRDASSVHLTTLKSSIAHSTERIEDVNARITKTRQYVLKQPETCKIASKSSMKPATTTTTTFHC